LAKDYNSGRQKTYFGRYRQEVIKVAALVKKHGDAYDGDLDLQKLDNFGSVNGQLKILDLGCFTGESC
jgi:hypothetical protein